MKQLVLAGAALALVAALRPAPEIPGRAIALIRCGGARSGTAFWIGPTRAITAAHVTAGDRCTVDGEPLEIVREDGAADIAELRSIAPHPYLRASCGGFHRAGMYRAFGYVLGMTRANMPWVATGFRDGSGQGEFIGEAHPGMSGGPVVDDRGRAAGLINQRWPARSRALRDSFVCRG